MPHFDTNTDQRVRPRRAAIYALAVVIALSAATAGTVLGSTVPAHALSGTGTASLGPGQMLTQGQYLRSDDGKYILIMQSDGNLVEYTTAAKWGTNRLRVLWSSSTSGHPGAYVVNQTDGHLVMYWGTGRG